MYQTPEEIKDMSAEHYKKLKLELYPIFNKKCPDFEDCDKPKCPYAFHQGYCRFGSKIEPGEECIDTQIGCMHRKT